MTETRGPSTFLLLSLLAGACDATEPDEPVTAAEELGSEDLQSTPELTTVSDWIDGELLTRVDIAEGHTVEFYEFEPGVVAALETFPADGGRSVYADVDAADAPSVLELYAHASDDPIPPELVAAHERAVLHDEEFAELRAYGDDEEGPPVAAQSLQAVPDTQAACSADLFNDNWGAQWFLNNFCQEGAFHNCQTNWSSFATFIEYTTWFRLNGMAAEFNTGARMYGGHWYKHCPCFWGCAGCASSWVYDEDYDLAIQPRQVRSWTYASGGYREGHVVGLSPCPRIHAAELTNK